MTRYYFAARYSRNAELRDYRHELLAANPDAVVTSRWIYCHGGAVPQSFGADALNSDPAGCWPYGLHDLEDLADADVLVSFTGGGGKGGRHVEHGYAMALGKRIVIVGPREHVFHTEPGTEVYTDWASFLASETVRARAAA